MLKEIHEDEHNDIYLTASFVLGPKHAIRGARDLAIRKALELKATHLFFLDDDITTPRDILARLLECDKPIVGALVHRDNGDPLVWREPKISDPIGAIQSYLDTDQDIGELVWYDHPKTGVFECAAVAVGCMLIKTEVLQSLNDTRWIFNYDETERSMGVRFCRFAQKHGWTVWCLPDSECVQK
jgi:GT2 family glycosyltransferase